MANDLGSSSSKPNIALRREPAYWHEHKTFVKERWIGRTILEVMVTDFYQRTSAYYQWAIYKGYCNINGEKVSHNYRLKSGDLLHNLVHRHEPAITAQPIKILYRDDEEGRLVVVKPGSIPVHAAGRYNKLTLIELLKRDLGISPIWTSNRIDRLTSGIMVCSTKKETAHKLSEDFVMGKVRKAYVCRVQGKFPEEELICKEPLVQCDRQTGVSVVHSIGKECETIFNRMSYDEETNTSVVYCRPITGRTHQIRAHVQYLGHSIPNDPIYNHSIWEKYPAQIFKQLPLKPDRWKVEPESSLDVYGSMEIDEIVAGLKMDRDEKDDWGRWKDETLFTEKLAREGIEVATVAGPNGESAAAQRERAIPSGTNQDSVPDETEYCPECLVPLTPDPEEEDSLFIYLHAIKYQTDDWTYEDDLPWWAHKDWKKRDHSYNGTSAVISKVKENGSDHSKQELGPAGRERTVDKELVKLPIVQPVLSLQEKGVIPNVSLKMPCQCGVALEVFGGMEDYAAIDIRQKIQTELPNEVIDLPDFRLYTSHIIVGPGLGARAAIDLWKGGHLSCVFKAYLVICKEAIPTEMLCLLAKERKENVSLQEGINQSKRAKARAKKAGVALDEKPVEIGEKLKARTETEEALLQILESGWDRAEQLRKSALQEWKSASDNDCEPTMGNILKFRASVDRTGLSLPTLKTADFEIVLGSMTWLWLNGDKNVKEGPSWTVDLKEPDLDVVVKMLPGWGEAIELDPYWRTQMNNPPSSFLYLLCICQQSEAIHRPHLPIPIFQGGTPLARYRAYTLAAALPIVETRKQHLTIWEPCVGTGSIAIELDSTLAKRECEYTIFASDLFVEEIEKARRAVQLCKTSNRVRLAQIDATDLKASVNFLGGKNVLDGIITVSFASNLESFSCFSLFILTK